MTETEYNDLVDQTLSRIESVIEDEGGDVECERISEGILELDFPNGSKIVINRQAAAQEIWVAAKSGGFHFKWDGGRWVDTRSGADLFSALSDYVSQQAGESIQITARG